MKPSPSHSLLAAAMVALLAGSTEAQTPTVTPTRATVGATSPDTVNREVSLKWLRNAGSTWAGSKTGAGIGRKVSAAGDVNGDGIADMLVSAYRTSASANPGTVYLIYGVDHDLPEVATLKPSSMSVTPSQRNSGFGPLTTIAKDTQGYVTLLGAQTGDRNGAGLAAAGDVNGDGFGDILIGAPFFDGAAGANSGAVYLIYGSDSLKDTIDLAFLTPGQGTVIEGLKGNDRLGASVAGLGDMNGDGTPDIAMGAYNASPPGSGTGFIVSPTRSGQTFVVFGNSSLGDSFSLVRLGSAGIVINGDGVGDQSGRSIAAAGDMNADGFADMVIGAQNHNAPGLTLSGAAYVIKGSATLPGRIDLGTLGGYGITINGVVNEGQLGWAVTGGADLNYDGFDDIAVGAPGYDASPFADSQEGRLYMVFGALSLPAKLNLDGLGKPSEFSGGGGHGGSTPAGSSGSNRVSGANSQGMNKPMTGASVTGANIGARVGSVIAMGGDMNGDRYADLLIGSASTNDSYLLHGSAFPAASLNLADLAHRGVVLEGSDQTHSLAFVGDVNGDKYGDFLVGNKAALHQRMFKAGTATVVKGAAHMLQATGRLAGGSTFEMIVHGTPNQPWLLMVSPDSLHKSINTGRGAWWLGPYFEVLDKTHGANGETLISVFIPAVAMVNGATVYWQALEAPTGRNLDLTQLLVTTVE